MIDALVTWNNFVTTPQRVMARWLHRRGWIVFYLDEDCRTRCTDERCWLNLYYDHYAALKREKRK